MIKIDIGDKIREARKAKGMTQEELGAILGVQKSAIAKYESGRVVNIKRSTLQKLAMALDLKGSDLIIESDPVSAADLLAKVLQDSQVVELLDDYWKLSESNKRIVLDLVKSLPKVM